MASCSREQHEDFFKLADSNGDGHLSFDELYGMLQSKGYQGDEDTIRVRNCIFYLFNDAPMVSLLSLLILVLVILDTSAHFLLLM